MDFRLTVPTKINYRETYLVGRLPTVDESKCVFPETGNVYQEGMVDECQDCGMVPHHFHCGMGMTCNRVPHYFHGGIPGGCENCLGMITISFMDGKGGTILKFREDEIDIKDIPDNWDLHPKSEVDRIARAQAIFVSEMIDIDSESDDDDE